MKQLFVILTLLTACGYALAQKGKTEYVYCAACHLTGGEGVPGAFPPLKDRIGPIASIPEGRDYLILTLKVGMIGTITIDNMPYSGAMPAVPSMTDQQLADVMNYVVRTFNKKTVKRKWKPFTAKEIAEVMTKYPGYTPSKTKQFRDKLFTDNPKLDGK